MLDYNTAQSKLILREYGRNVQKLAEYLPNVEDRDKRTAYAYTLVNLMRQLNPNVKDGETTQKIWDDLFIITNFTLDVDAPFPPPPEDVLTKKPNKVPYSKESESAKYKHYGKNLEKLIEQAGELEEEEKRDATIYLGRLMKTFYITWNRDNIDDEVIVKQLRKLSRGKLDISLEEVKAKNLFDSLSNTGNNNSNNNNSNNSNKGRSNKGRRSNNNRRKKN